MFKTLAVLGFVGLLAGCSTTNPVLERVAGEKTFAMIDQTHTTDEFLLKVFKDTNSIIINEGTGGHLDGMIYTLYYLDQNPDKTIVIDGPCASACTLLLTRPNNVVFTENAEFGFHSASVRETINGNVREFMSERGNTKMLRLFPKAVRAWIIKNRAFESLDLTYMDYQTARKFFPTMYVSSDELPELEVYGSVSVGGEIELPEIIIE